jgi:hypothetical protein
MMATVPVLTITGDARLVDDQGILATGEQVK